MKFARKLKLIYLFNAFKPSHFFELILSNIYLPRNSLEGLNCLQTHIEQCGTPIQRDLFEFTIEQFQRSIDKFCKPGELREGKSLFTIYIRLLYLDFMLLSSKRFQYLPIFPDL